MGNPLTKIENTAKAGFLGYYVVGDSLASGGGLPSTVPMVLATVHTIVLGAAANTYLLREGPLNALPYMVIAGGELGLGAYEGYSNRDSGLASGLGKFLGGNPDPENPIPPGFKDATQDRKDNQAAIAQTVKKAVAVKQKVDKVANNPLGDVQVAPTNGKLTKDDLAYEQQMRRSYWNTQRDTRKAKTGEKGVNLSYEDKKKGDAIWEAWKADFEKKRAANPVVWDTVATAAINRTRINKNSTDIKDVNGVLDEVVYELQKNASYVPNFLETKCYITWGAGKTVTSGQSACDRAFGKGGTVFQHKLKDKSCAAWENSYSCMNWVNPKTNQHTRTQPTIRVPVPKKK